MSGVISGSVALYVPKMLPAQDIEALEDIASKAPILGHRTENYETTIICRYEP